MDEIIRWYGSQANMSRALKIDRSAISLWVKQGYLPAHRAIQVEIQSGGRFKAVDISRI